MEGILYISPDRGTIIGRSIWKPRFVVVGSRDAKPSKSQQLPAQMRQQEQSPQPHQEQRWQRKASTGSSTPSQMSHSTHASTERTTSTTSAPSTVASDGMYLSVFKANTDFTPIQQYAISSISDCVVQTTAYKQGPVLPTLIISIAPDPVTDKLRRRHSSRTAGFTTRDVVQSTLWLRSGEEEQQKHLQDWCDVIQGIKAELGPVSARAAVVTEHVEPKSRSQHRVGTRCPMSPMSPTFHNPFGNQRDAQHMIFQNPFGPQRPCSDYVGGRASAMSLKASSQTNRRYSSRDRERPRKMSYDSPSLRSRRSDLSHASSNVPSHVVADNGSSTNNVIMSFFHIRSIDMQPPRANNGLRGDASDSWPSVQGRSAVSSPVHGRDSVSDSSLSAPPAPAFSSSTPQAAAPVVEPSPPPGPRETILDRAFQMHFVPRGDYEHPGEARLSSLARFEALMRKEEERKRLRQSRTPSDLKVSATAMKASPSEATPKSNFDLGEDEEDDGASDSDSLCASGHIEDTTEEEDDDDDDGGDALSTSRSRKCSTITDGVHLRPHLHLDEAVDINPNALRALDFIAGRHRDAKRALEAVALQTRTESSTDEDKAPRTTDSGVYCPSPKISPAPPQQLFERKEEPASRPRTGYTRKYPAIAQRTHSQPQLTSLAKQARVSVTPTSQPPLPPRLTRPTQVTAGTKPDGGRAKTPVGNRSSRSASSTSLQRSVASSTVNASGSATSDKRPSMSAIKRLSFTEFTRRLSSSTSSLLLSQSSSSAGSNPNTVPEDGLEAETTTTPPPSASNRNEKFSREVSPGVTEGATTATATAASVGSHGPAQQHASTASSLTSSPSLSLTTERCHWRGRVRS